MAATNFTPISLYYSTTASAVPTAANLVPGELAINTNDGKLYYEDSSGVVQVLATKSTGSIGGSNTQVQFNNSGSLGGSSSFTWDGTTVTATKFAGALNGTVGATTASTGAFTTINASTSITNAGLTSGRVTYAGASGLLSDSANLTWNGSSFQAVGAVYVGNGQSTATLGGTTATAGGLTSKDLTLSAWSPTSGSNEYGGDLYLSAGRAIGNGSGKLGSVYIKVGTGGAGSSTAGTLLDAYVAQDTAQNWYIGGTAKLTLNSTTLYTASGVNVGIGTSSPATKLNIENAGECQLQMAYSSTIFGRVGRLSSGNYEFSSYENGGSLLFGTTTSNGSTTERMRIDSSGNVGIGTTATSTYRLNVKGSGSVGDSSVYTQFTTADTGTTASDGLLIGLGVGSSPIAYIIQQENAALATLVNGSERMRIDSSGNVLVGATASGAANGGIQLQPAGNGASIPLIASSGNSASDGAVTMAVYSTSASQYQFYVGYAGTVFARSIVISALSDARLKENIVDLDVGIDAIMALKPRKFDWKDGQGTNKKNVRGFIAQELEEVFPDLIDEWRDPAPEGEEPYRSVRQDLMPVLVKAIQEQQALIESLTTRLTALESK